MINVQIHFDFTDQIDKKRIEKFEVDLNIEPGISFINGLLKNGISLRDDTIYIKILIFNGYN